MSGSVDDEVVRMRFDNNTFERGVSATLSTLQRLKNALQFSGGAKGLDDVEAKANKFNLQSIANGVDSISKKFSALSIIGITALTNIANRAVDAGLKLAKSFTIAPIADGFKSYETQINAAQTIMANTGASLPVVEAQLKELQTYAQQTVYNFADMAANIGTFTAAGVKLGPATQAIKGLGNAAALSGVSSERLSGAYIQVSQALSTGTFRLQDWNSLSQAGLGGQNIQNALKSTAESIKGSGPKMDAAIKKYGNFRESLTSGWLTGDIFNKTMGVMAGKVDKATGKTVAFSVAELEAKGYTKAHAIELNKLSAASIKSATEIRTYTQLTSALKEEVAGAYGSLFKAIFGNLNAATTIFSALHTTLENALTGPINNLTKLVEGAAKLGARAKAVDAFKNVFKALGAIIKPIKEAFRDFFPKQTAAGLANLINKFDQFSKKLIIGKDTADKLHRTFAGVFAIFSIGKSIISGIFSVFAHLFGAVAQGSGSFLTLTARIGDMIVAFAKALQDSDSIRNIFSIIGSALQIPIHLIGLFGALIGGVFSKFHPKSASGFITSLDNSGGALEHAAAVMRKVSGYFGSLQGKIGPAIKAIVSAFSKIGGAISSGLGSAQFSNILKGLEVGLLGGILLTLKKFLSGGLGGIHIEPSAGIFGQAKEALEGVTGSLKAMQTQLKAKALLEIAIAMGVLAVSVVALANTDPKKLQAGLQAMAIGFGQLLLAMGILVKISGNAGFVKIPLIAASLDMLAVAILLLSVAVIAMSQLSWQELEKGLVGVGALLLGLSIAAYALSANSIGLVAASVGMIAIAVAINLLFIAVKAFSTLSWKEMIQGLEGVGIVLAGIALAMRLMPKNMLFQAAALLLISTAILELYFAVKAFATLSYGDMLKGLVGVAGGLLAIALGLKAMPPTFIADAIGLNIVAAALLTLGKALAQMAKLSWTEIARGLVALGGSLLVLAGGLALMDGSIAGALAMIIIAKALSIFVPVLVTLGKQKFSTIAKGLGFLAAGFAVIGIAAALLTPVIPAMLGLGVAIGLLGVAVLAFGAGAALLGVGLTAIAAAGGGAIAVLIAGIKGVISLLPLLVTAVATAFVQFVTIIGSHAPQIVGALVKILNQLLQAIPKIIPSLVQAINALVVAILSVLTTNAPKIIQAGLTLLLDLLKGIRDNIGEIVGVVASIIANFLNALANNLGKIINAGVNLLTKLLVGIASALGKMPTVVLKVVAAFLSALLGNLPKIVAMGVNMLGHLVSGIGSAVGRMAGAAANAVGHFISGLGAKAASLAEKGAGMVGDVVSGVGGALGDLYQGGLTIAGKLIEGIIQGVKNLIGHAISAVKSAVGSIVGGAKKVIGVFGSPSKVFCELGENIPTSLAIGIDAKAKLAANSGTNLGKVTVDAMKNTISAVSSAISEANLDANPTVTPVLDLSQFKKDATQLSNLVTTAPVNAKLSYTQAADISTAQRASAEAASVVPETPAPVLREVKFEQNNYSPKAISPVDVYRNTNNQLSQFKTAIGIPS